MKCIYLVQSDKARIPFALPAGSDLLLLQWQESFEPREDSFHLPKCSWAAGRNALYGRAVRRADYDYYVFLDDDAVCEFELAEFEGLLAEHNPRRAVPCFLDHVWNDRRIGAIDAVKYVDHAFMALRKDCAGQLLPYSLRYDETCWCLSSEDMCERFWKKWPYQTLRFNRLIMDNPLHREYPREGYPGFPRQRVRPDGSLWPLVVLSWFAGRCWRKARRMLAR